MVLCCYKKIVFLVILAYVFFCPLAFLDVHSDDINEGEPNTQVFLSSSAVKIISPPRVDATAAIVMDMESGRVLYSKNADVRKAIASTTKIMTAIVAIENGNLNDTVIVSKRAAGTGGSSINLNTGEKLTLKELLYGLLMNSGNDASIAIAEHVGGTVENFVEMMNIKANDMGLKDTAFKTPHGLDAVGHYSTANELALMTKYALGLKTFSEIVRTVSTNITGRGLYNTNEMLGYYPGTDGVKTGYTGQAGRCLVCSVTRDNWRIISVVLGCPTRTIRAESSRKILDYSFNNYKQYTLLKSNENIKNIRVIKGKSSNVPVVAADEIKLPLSHEELSALETEIELPDSFVAPVKGEIEVGNIRFVLDGKVIAESVLKTGNGVERKKVTDYLNELFGTWGNLMKLGTQWY